MITSGSAPGVARGSSPRVRGFDRVGGKSRVRRGFIPACAGFCFSAPYCGRSRGVHPRVCGVLCDRPAPTATTVGSSPRVRGFAGVDADDRLRSGFIPACAGFCPRPDSVVRKIKVHPRVCGVLMGQSVDSLYRDGSSPRVRGFAIASPRENLLAGFIPACAGFCIPPFIVARPDEVHPRVCGVLARPRSSPAGSRGSSPRVRGFGLAVLEEPNVFGFIPACAGFCTPLRRLWRSSRVHPRVCGVLIASVSCACVIFGSSPRVRGFVSGRPA